jgi:hypothetical protein
MIVDFFNGKLNFWIKINVYEEVIKIKFLCNMKKPIKEKILILYIIRKYILTNIH